MIKVDLKKELPRLYQASAKEPEMLEVPPLSFLMLDGAGDPNAGPHFPAAVEALFTVSYALKFMIKKELAVDYGVLPLEGLWYAEDLSQFSPERQDLWLWTLMIRQPQFVSSRRVWEALEQVGRKKKLPVLAGLKFLKYREGLAAQIMYVGPFSAEGPTVARLHEFIRERGYELRGKHHEIYLSDPRRTAPEKLKTIIRQPVS